LVAVVQQAYVCGVSTRRVDQLVESLVLRALLLVTGGKRKPGAPAESPGGVRTDFRVSTREVRLAPSSLRPELYAEPSSTSG
jgi:hypothetical protein